VTCENCGKPTNDWLDTGYFCSEECKQAWIMILVRHLTGETQ
jgi:endogenous inhibitor of DNA gyrase (YacG/DUF329 family)